MASRTSLSLGQDPPGKVDKFEKPQAIHSGAQSMAVGHVSEKVRCSLRSALSEWHWHIISIGAMDIRMLHSQALAEASTRASIKHSSTAPVDKAAGLQERRIMSNLHCEIIQLITF